MHFMFEPSILCLCELCVIAIVIITMREQILVNVASYADIIWDCKIWIIKFNTGIFLYIQLNS